MKQTKISDLIKLLEQSLKENGDVPISVYSSNCYGATNVHNASIEIDMEYDYAHKSEPYRGAPYRLIIKAKEI